MADHIDVATRIVNGANMYGRETPLLYGREQALIGLIAVALQEAFDLGFEAAGGQVIPLASLSSQERG
jgi:hypothetical protein